MSLIITATDFSDIATNAVHYACRMASDINAGIVVLHSYSVPLTLTDGPMPVNFVNDAQQDAEDQVKKLLATLSAAYPTIAISGSAVYGDVLDAINDYADEHEKPWMIVIGNSITGDNDTWPGTTVMDAFNDLAYPVLAIPPSATYSRPSNICFAFDNKHTGNIAPMVRLANVVQQFGVALHVLNAQAGANASEADIDMEVRRLLAPTDAHYTVVADADIEHAIEAFVTASNADMLVMIPRRHSFFEGLFHKSHTHAAAHRSNIPVLALHDGKQ